MTLYDNIITTKIVEYGRTNLQTATNLGSTTNNSITSTHATTGFAASGDIITDGTFHGDGSGLTGVSVSTPNLSEVTAEGSETSTALSLTNSTTAITASGDIITSKVVEASGFIGDGSLLTGISVGTPTLQEVTTEGATTSDQVSFTNAATSIISNGEINVGTANFRTSLSSDASGNHSVTTEGGSGTIYLNETERADGRQWRTAKSSISESWRAICYGNGLFVAVSSTGGIMISEDGENWRSSTAPEVNWWRGVTYGNGLFVAVSYDGTNRIMTSPDGVNWTSRSAPSMGIAWSGDVVTYGNGLFVAVGLAGSYRAIYSTDGITWSPGSTSPISTACSWRSMCYGNGLFVAVGSTGAAATMIATSPDGDTWTSRTAPSTATWYGVTYGNGLFVAISRTLVTYNIMTSEDGITWTGRTAPVDQNWRCITYGNGIFVSLSTNGTQRAMTSKDGINWTLSDTPVGGWGAICFGNNLFVSAASSGDDRVLLNGRADEITAIKKNLVNDGNHKILGQLAIGTSTLLSRLHVSQDSDTVATFDRTTNDGTIISLRQAGVEEGTISVAGSTVSYNAFTGGHYGLYDPQETYEIGMIVKTTSSLVNREVTSTVIIEEAYSEEIPLEEKLKDISDYQVINHPAVTEEITEELLSYQPTHSITPTCSANCKTVFGVVGQLDFKEDIHLIFSLGDGVILVTDTNGNIENGDYITTSSVVGYGMKQDDDLLHSYTVAKALCDVDWSTIEVDPEKGFKWKMIPCTYHCG